MKARQKLGTYLVNGILMRTTWRSVPIPAAMSETWMMSAGKAHRCILLHAIDHENK